MTQLFAEDGTVQPVTVIKAGPCVVVQAKTAGTDGYEAVQLGLVEERPARVTKALAGHYKKANVPPTRVRREMKLHPSAAAAPLDAARGALSDSRKTPGAPKQAGGDGLKPGDQVLVDAVFVKGERVDVIGVSRGHGFQGVVKRHHFRGGAATHGSMFHRAPGSIGASSYPSRVIKGMRAAGRMGGRRTTTLNLRVERVDGENNLLLVRGAVPGADGGYVLVRKAVAAKPEPQPQVEKAAKGAARGKKA